MRIITTSTTTIMAALGRFVLLLLIAEHSFLRVSAGWLAADIGQSCTTRCTNSNLACINESTNRQNLVASAVIIPEIKFIATATTCAAAPVPDGSASGTAPYFTVTASSAPPMDGDSCSFKGPATSPSTCGQEGTGNNRRLCCCLSSTATPAEAASECPLTTPSAMPSRMPSRAPSSKPSKSARPSSKPSVKPSRKPSAKPSRKPSAKPSRSAKPSSKPSRKPSRKPTAMPSRKPSRMPSRKPSAMPSTYFDTCFGVDIPVIGLIFKLICLILSIFS